MTEPTPRPEFTPDIIPLNIRVQMVAFAAQKNAERFKENNWIENDTEGFTGWRWEKYNVEPVIVCAANRYRDFVIVGPRHYSTQMAFVYDLITDEALREYAEGKGEQGFIDQYGRYWNREDAMELCKKNGRPLLEEGQSDTSLFSEHLY